MLLSPFLIFVLKPQPMHEIYYPFHGVFRSPHIPTLWFISKPAAAKPAIGGARKSCLGSGTCVSTQNSFVATLRRIRSIKFSQRFSLLEATALLCISACHMSLARKA